MRSWCGIGQFPAVVTHLSTVLYGSAKAELIASGSHWALQPSPPVWEARGGVAGAADATRAPCWLNVRRLDDASSHIVGAVYRTGRWEARRCVSCHRRSVQARGRHPPLWPAQYGAPQGLHVVIIGVSVCAFARARPYGPRATRAAVVALHTRRRRRRQQPEPHLFDAYCIC
jgi:hypothetical protein